MRTRQCLLLSLCFQQLSLSALADKLGARLDLDVLIQVLRLSIECASVLRSRTDKRDVPEFPMFRDAFRRAPLLRAWLRRRPDAWRGRIQSVPSAEQSRACSASASIDQPARFVRANDELSASANAAQHLSAADLDDSSQHCHHFTSLVHSVCFSNCSRLLLGPNKCRRSISHTDRDETQHACGQTQESFLSLVSPLSRSAFADAILLDVELQMCAATRHARTERRRLEGHDDRYAAHRCRARRQPAGSELRVVKRRLRVVATQEETERVLCRARESKNRMSTCSHSRLKNKQTTRRSPWVAFRSLSNDAETDSLSRNARRCASSANPLLVLLFVVASVRCCGCWCCCCAPPPRSLTPSDSSKTKRSTMRDPPTSTMATIT